MAQTVKYLSTIRETRVPSLGQEDPLEKEMAIHSSTISWKIPWTEEPGSLHGPWGRKESDTTERLHFPFPMAKMAGREEAELTSFQGHTKITTIYGATICDN